MSVTSTDITLTAAAKAHIVACLGKHPGMIGVRFSVKTQGCSGLSYVVDYISAPGEGDILCASDVACQIFLEASSVPYLNGTTVDYVREAFGSKLVFQNPNLGGRCGCGESFTGVGVGAESKAQS